MDATHTTPDPAIVAEHRDEIRNWLTPDMARSVRTWYNSGTPVGSLPVRLYATHSNMRGFAVSFSPAFAAALLAEAQDQIQFEQAHG